MSAQLSAERRAGAAVPRRGSRDLLASIVVFLVALPLCMGIAIASGAPVSAGLISGIVGGLVVGLLSGCPLQVSGPAAGLTIVSDAIREYGLEMLGLIVFLAGAFQLLAAALRLGQWFRAVSPAVVRGMLGGIGVLIFASQFHVMLDDVPRGSALQNLATIPQALVKAAQPLELPVRDQRQLCRGLLQAVGDLHRRQLALNEQVTEALPDHQQALQGGISIELAPFVEPQQALAAELETILEANRQIFDLQPEKDRKARRLGEAARRLQQACLDDLQTNRAHLIISTQKDAAAALTALQGAYQNHELAAGVGVLTILTLVFWNAFVARRGGVIPAPLAAVVMAVLIANVWQLPVLYVEAPASLAGEIHFPRWSILQDAPWSGVISAALLIAVLASAQTLLTAAAVDALHSGPRTRYDRELLAQGVGNCLCGLLGALPVAGVIVRSSANLQAGAQSRWSAVLHGLWLLIFVVALGGLLKMIPTSALAAILVYTGYKLVDWQQVRELARYGWAEAGIYAATLVGVVARDLLTGVLIGLGLEILKLAFQSSRLKIRARRSDADTRWEIRLEGRATFLKLPKLARALERVPAGSAVSLEADTLEVLDHACLELIKSWSAQVTATGGEVRADWRLLEALARHDAAS